MHHANSVIILNFTILPLIKSNQFDHVPVLWYIFLFTGGETGFVPDVLLIFKSGMKTGDYHDEMNAGNFTRKTYI
jgi:hypothetical protein